MSVYDFLMIIFGLTIFVLLFIANFKLVYRRFLKSYKPEIEKYLKEHNLNLGTTYAPDNNDWEASPFKKPPSFSFGFYNIVGLSWNDQKYRIIETNKGKRIWLEIDTTFFHKPKLTFRFGMKEKLDKDTGFRNRNIVVVTNNCPACGCSQKEYDFECPDCGLNFK